MRDHLQISLLVPGMPFNGDTVEKESLGGSESAGHAMARELAALGHRVTIFTNGEPGVFDGVTYLHCDSWRQYISSVPHDISIVQRATDPYVIKTLSKFNIVWCHDLALARQINEFRGALWNIDRIIVLSDFMKKQYEETYDLPERLLFTSRNGIDLFRFPEINLAEKNPKNLVYSARPERGLDILLDKIFPKLLEKDPEFNLTLYGYNNPVTHLQDFYRSLNEKATNFGDRVTLAGHLSKNDLYKEYVKGGLYVYPTPSPLQPSFCEISCISVMESMASGMPVVSSARGALPETLCATAGELIEGDAWTDEYQDKFVETIMSYVNDRQKYESAIKAGLEHSKNNSWLNIAEEWTECFYRLFDEHNDDRTRLAYHFYKRNDTFAALKALDGEDNPLADRLLEKIETHYPFLEDQEKLKEHYKECGKETTKSLSNIPLEHFRQKFEVSTEQRFDRIRDSIVGRKDIVKVLDFGCGHGWSTIYLHNALGKKWTGIDLDPGAIKWCNKFKKNFARNPNDLTFIEGDEDTDLSEQGPFDCIIVSEVLEHCLDPVGTLNKLESWAHDDTLIIITVPYGPTEFASPNWKNFRGHLWEFEIQDLEDILVKKDPFTLDTIPEGTNPELAEQCGFHLIKYLGKKNQPLQQINWDRKLRLQRPAQTVSANLIAGPDAEDTLRWCLKSIYWQVDEIVIADTGLSNMAKIIADEFEARLVPGSNPIEHGFDVPRNEVLTASNTDWIFWIDTDEKLVDSYNITKYLRQNVWNGYAVRQHHFSIEGSFLPDMPVRLFRRFSHDGQQMKFWGVCHEHPELDINKGPGEVLILSDVHIGHVGYLSETIRRHRFVRNRPLVIKDSEKYPDRLLQKHFLMRDNILLCMYELQQNNGQITDTIKQRAEETVQLYKDHFLGKPSYTNIDSLKYYTDALRLLGRGFDVNFGISVNRDGKGDNVEGPLDTILARFETPEEFITELQWRAKEKTDPFEKEWW